MNESPRLPHGRVRILRHILLASAFVVLSVLFMRFFPKRDTISRISIGTAYSALFLTGLALLLGPWNVLRRQFNPVSFDLRRDTGIWAGIAAVVHVRRVPGHNLWVWYQAPPAEVVIVMLTNEPP